MPRGEAVIMCRVLGGKKVLRSILCGIIGRHLVMLLENCLTVRYYVIVKLHRFLFRPQSLDLPIHLCITEILVNYVIFNLHNKCTVRAHQENVETLRKPDKALKYI